MSELKFRAWDKRFSKYRDVEAVYSDGSILAIMPPCNDREQIKAEDVIVEQYTGLKDKNGKEIYEGDILRFKGGSKSVVKFCEMKDSDCTYYYLGWASMQDGYEPMSLCEEAGFCEVIGNIHENPELLEEE